MVPVVASTSLERLHVQGAKDKTVNWKGAFASCGGNGAVASSTIVYEIEPGNHLGWHTDATEETQYIIAGTGTLHMEDGEHAVGPGSVFVLPANVRHDLANTGRETLRIVEAIKRPVSPPPLPGGCRSSAPAHQAAMAK